MTVLGFNAETQKPGGRWQKFSLGVHSVNKSLNAFTIQASMSHYGTGRSILSSVDQQASLLVHLKQKLCCFFHVIFLFQASML